MPESGNDLAAIGEEMVYRFGPAAAIVGISVAIGVVIEILQYRMLTWRAEPDRKRMRSAIAISLRGLPTLVAALIGARLALANVDLASGVTDAMLRALSVIALVGMTLVCARVAGAAVEVWMSRDDVALPSSTIFVILARGIVLGVGLLTVMALTGIPIGPLVTALGVGGIGLSLALQDPLSNIFSGIQVLVSGEVRPGDFIRLQSGEEGWVHDITWRNTTLRLRTNDLVIVPNSVFANSMVENFTTMDTEHIAWVPVGVSYDSDLELVDIVTREVAEEVLQEVPGGVSSWEPWLRYVEFGDSAIHFRVGLRVTAYVNHWLVVSEFIKRLHRRYADEGIRIPYPQRDVHVIDSSSPVVRETADPETRAIGSTKVDSTDQTDDSDHAGIGGTT